MKRTLLIIGFALMLLTPFVTSGQDNDALLVYNARVPLGVESFELEPSGKYFYVMASVESPNFQGLRRVMRHDQSDLLNTDGTPVRYYPEHLQFRLSASMRERMIDEPYKEKLPVKVEDLLQSLRFRLKVFHGIRYWFIGPKVVQDIGMPRNVAYDERIYGVSFDIRKIPIQDRIIMEVLMPNGQRLCKFHLDLY